MQEMQRWEGGARNAMLECKPGNAMLETQCWKCIAGNAMLQMQCSKRNAGNAMLETQCWKCSAGNAMQEMQSRSNVHWSAVKT